MVHWPVQKKVYHDNFHYAKPVVRPNSDQGSIPKVKVAFNFAPDFRRLIFLEPLLLNQINKPFAVIFLKLLWLSQFNIALLGSNRLLLYLVIHFFIINYK